MPGDPANNLGRWWHQRQIPSWLTSWGNNQWLNCISLAIINLAIYVYQLVDYVLSTVGFIIIMKPLSSWFIVFDQLVLLCLTIGLVLTTYGWITNALFYDVLLTGVPVNVKTWPNYQSLVLKLIKRNPWSTGETMWNQMMVHMMVCRMFH